MHGCGNDFVVLDERTGPLGLTPSLASAIADRRTGVGCDQLIVLEPAPPDAQVDAFMRIRNPDGSEAGACGNATRCVAHLLAAETGRDRHIIRTISGDLPSEILPNGLIRVDMGPVRLDWRDIPVSDVKRFENELLDWVIEETPAGANACFAVAFGVPGQAEARGDLADTNVIPASVNLIGVRVVTFRFEMVACRRRVIFIAHPVVHG